MRKEDVKIGMRVDYFLGDKVTDSGTVIGFDEDNDPQITWDKGYIDYTYAGDVEPSPVIEAEAGSTVQQTVYMDEPPPEFKVGDKIKFTSPLNQTSFGVVMNPMAVNGRIGVRYNDRKQGSTWVRLKFLSLVEEPKTLSIDEAVKAFKDLVPGLYKTNLQGLQKFLPPPGAKDFFGLNREGFNHLSGDKLPISRDPLHPEYKYFLKALEEERETEVLRLNLKREYEAKQKLCDCGNLPHFKFCKAFDKRYDY